MKILFASTYCLLDTTSGVAVNLRSLLAGLSDQGHVSEAVTAAIFDPEREVSLEAVLSHNPLPFKVQAQRTEHEVIEVLAGRLRHTVLRTASSRREALAPREEEALLSLVESKIRDFQPDILLTYGGLPAERRIHRVARRQDIPVVFYLANGLYTKAETFLEVDQILVPSKFLSELYRERLGLRSHVLYPIIARERCVVGAGVTTPFAPGRFITLINPVLQKGLGLWVRLAAEALRLLPGTELLVVEGRWTKEDVMRAGIRLENLTNVTFAPNRADMREVYAGTRILLFPSLWEEAFGQSIVEAQLNGIPVLASRRGGIPEALNGAGFLLDVPDRCLRDYRAIPTAEEVQPWVAQIRVLLEDPEAYEQARRRAYQAAEGFSPERILRAAADLFLELPGLRRGDRRSNEGGRVSAMEDSNYVRQAAVAGQFYPRDGGELDRQLHDLIQLSSVVFVVQGAVVPHAGYAYSGQIAGKVYGRIHIPEQVVLLGPNHTGRGARSSLMAEGAWETPLGRVAVDAELAESLLEACPSLERDVEAHRAEHSLEVQIPFLYHLSPSVRIVPITLMPRPLEDCLKLGQEIAEVIQGWRSPVLLVASTDMTHYEPREKAREKDRLAVEQMIDLSPEGLYQTVGRHRISMCGFIPATVVLAACRSLGARQVELVGYSDSGEASGDIARVVGYAGLVIRG